MILYNFKVYTFDVGIHARPFIFQAVLLLQTFYWFGSYMLSALMIHYCCIIAAASMFLLDTHCYNYYYYYYYYRYYYYPTVALEQSTFLQYGIAFLNTYLTWP